MVAKLHHMLVHTALAAVCKANSPALPVVALQGVGDDLPTQKEQGKRAARLSLLSLGSGEPINDFLWPVPSEEINCTVKIHGHSSAHVAKQSYTLKLRDAAGQKLNVGFGHKWRHDNGFDLFGPYADRSLIRNALVFSLAHNMGVEAPRGVLVELYHKNGDALSYQGVYMILELVSRDRLGLKHGDFLIQYDWPDSDPERRHAWRSGPSAFMLKYPKDKVGPGDPDQLTLAPYNLPPIGTKTYDMAQLVNETFGIQSQPDLSHVNVDSFVDYFLLTELSGNVDAYRFSTYFHYKHSQLFAGPAWDDDLSLGNSDNNGQHYGLDHWQFMWAAKDGSLVAKFVEKLVLMGSGVHNSSFVNKCGERWAHLRRNVLSDESIETHLFAYVYLLNESGAVARNFQVWGPIEGPLRGDATVTAMMGMLGRTDPQRTFDSEIEFVRDWLHQKVNFMDSDVGLFQHVLPPDAPRDADPLSSSRVALGALVLGILLLPVLLLPHVRCRIATKLGATCTATSSTEPLLRAEESHVKEHGRRVVVVSEA